MGKGKNKIAFLIFCCGVYSGCGRTAKLETSTPIDSASLEGEIEYDKLFKLESYLVSGTVAEAELQVIDSSCAILVYPTEEQFEAIKLEEGEENFETIVDDGNFYQASAMELLDSLGITTVTATKRLLRLNGTESWTLDIRKKHLPEWNLIFFNTKKEPWVVPAAGLEKQKILDYFEPAK